MSRFQIRATPIPATDDDDSSQRSSIIDNSSSSSSDDDDDDDISTLPYPTELPRSDFLQKDFNAQTYLNSLRNRHQTLQDLRADLRSRSQLLNKELLDLVNGNYEDFLSLAAHLKGGEEQVEGVRVGVLGFGREVQAIKTGVGERKGDVKGLLEEKKRIRREVVVGRLLLEVGERVAELEVRLGIEDEEEDVDEDEEDDERMPQLQRLQRYAGQYLMVEKLIERIGPEHPFLLAKKGRMDKIKKTLLLDLATALRQAKTDKSAESLMVVMKLYADLGAEVESVKVLKAG